MRRVLHIETRAIYGLLLGVALAGCAGGNDVPPNVRFAVIVDLTGSLAHPQWEDAAELGIAHATEGLQLAGGYRELALGVKVHDSRNERETALRRATDQYSRGRLAIIADTSDNALAIMRTVYDKTAAAAVALPVVCIACTSPDLGNPAAAVANRADEAALRNQERWGFRTSTASHAEAMILLNIAKSLGDRGDTTRDATNKIAMEVVDDFDGAGLLQGIRDARPTLYPNVIVEVVSHRREIAVEAHSWSDDLVRLVNDRNEENLGNVDGRADVVMEATYPLYGASLTRAFVEAQVSDTVFLHHHNWRHDQILAKLSTFDVEGHEGVSHAIVDNCGTSGATFWQAVQDRAGRAPSLFDAQTYDAVMLLALATVAALHANDITPAELRPDQLRDALHTVSAIPATDPRYDAALEGSRVAVTAGAEGFARGVEAILNDQPVDYVGASGPVDFDEYGNVRGNFARYRVERGRFVDVETYDCVTDATLCPGKLGACGF